MSYQGLFMADVHLFNQLPYAQRREAAHPLTDRLHELSHSVFRVCGEALDRGITDVWFIGDLVDRRLMDGVTLDVVVRMLVAITRTFGMKVYIVPGNHEAFDKGANAFVVDAFGALPGVHVIRDGRLTEFGELPVWAFAYQPERLLLPKLAEVPSGSITLLHQTMLGARVGPWASDIGIAPAALEHVYVVAGHFHDPQELPGSPGRYLGAGVQHHFGDVGSERGAWIGTFSSFTNITWERLPLRAPTFHVIEADAAKFSPELITAPDDSYVRVVLTGTPADLAASREMQQTLTRESAERWRVLLWEEQPIIEARARIKMDEHGVKRGSVSLKDTINPYVLACDVTGYDRKRLLELGEEILEEVAP